MKIKMTQMEVWCIEQSKKLKGIWDYTCVSNDSFQNGWHKFRQEFIALIISNNNELNLNKDQKEKLINLINNVGKDIVELEMNDGTHQLSRKSYETR